MGLGLFWEASKNLGNMVVNFYMLRYEQGYVFKEPRPYESTLIWSADKESDPFGVPYNFSN